MTQPDPNQTLHEVLAALHGDKDSLGSLLRRYRNRLVAVAIANGAYRSRDDVAQDSLVKIFQAINANKMTVTSVDQFRAWVHTVARNTARDYVRKEGRQMRHPDSLFMDDAEGRAAEQVAGKEPTPSFHAQMNEMVSELRQLHEARLDRIAALRWPDQVLVNMREGEGMSFRAIAQELGAVVRKPLKEDAMRMKYTRLVKEQIGTPVTSIPPD